jgi:hypothetical protein
MFGRLKIPGSRPLAVASAPRADACGGPACAERPCVTACEYRLEAAARRAGLSYVSLRQQRAA